GKEPRAIDYYEENSKKIEDYGKYMKDKPYMYGKVILPHDGAHDRLATGMSYQAQFEQMGFEVAVIPQTPDLMADINTVRQTIPMIWIDKRKCPRLVEC